MKATHLASIELDVANINFNNNKQMRKVEIWEGTLDAVNALLYGNDGANLAGIIDDMCPRVMIDENSSEDAVRSAKQLEAERQLVKLNIGLAFKGIQPTFKTYGFRVDKSWSDNRPPRMILRKYKHVSLIKECAYYFSSDVAFGEKAKDEWEIIKTPNGDYVTCDEKDTKDIEDSQLHTCPISNMDDDMDEDMALVVFAKAMKAYREKNQAPSAPAQ